MIDLKRLRRAAEANGSRSCSISGDDIIELLDMIEKPRLFNDE